MKVRKKRKEAEREGEASAIMVSQGALPAHSLIWRCFLGQGPASVRQQGFTLVDIFDKKDTERGQGGREAAEGIWRVSFLQRERLRDVQCFVYSLQQCCVDLLSSFSSWHQFPLPSAILLQLPSIPLSGVWSINQTEEGAASNYSYASTS